MAFGHKRVRFVCLAKEILFLFIGEIVLGDWGDFCKVCCPEPLSFV